MIIGVLRRLLDTRRENHRSSDADLPMSERWRADDPHAARIFLSDQRALGLDLSLDRRGLGLKAGLGIQSNPSVELGLIGPFKLNQTWIVGRVLDHQRRSNAGIARHRNDVDRRRRFRSAGGIASTEQRISLKLLIICAISPVFSLPLMQSR
jgi:hypothetical protein